MNLWNLIIRIIFLSQTTIGILGNFSFIFYYLVLYYRECTLKPTDLILMNLITANVMIILSAGVPHTMTRFLVSQLLNDFGCRLILYIQRIGRSLSIATSCLLSVFQAMTISPRESCWKYLKVKAAKYIGQFITLLWFFYMSMHFIFFIYPFIKRSNKNMTRTRNFGHCSIVVHNEISDSLFAAMVMIPEVLFSLLITWTSSSMIVILYRHKQRVQHIHSTHSSSRTSPESRATQNILTLVSTFLFFYTFSSILQGCIALLYNHSWWLLNISCLTSLCFPSLGPFVLMNHYSTVSRLSWSWIRNKHRSIYFRYVNDVLCGFMSLLTHHPEKVNTER
ncbi:vomeronasal type-1 receptor 4-like [Peromyscus californicus insignis]|uniref:vomeronasal type-1 receptor 4-like n=1 Tax=Peromyscus californicus insignis TaxID=564181 RepID=UPI0022A7A728|nr:vomeronasal type-1 receptor 4-like [Peromyscus californicus insignis]